MDFRQRKEIPERVAKRLLGASDAEWRRLVAERVIEFNVMCTGRGSELKTNFTSIERAANQPRR